MKIEKKTLVIFSLFVSFLISCGGEDSIAIAKGNGIEVTDIDFMAEFNRLMPADQVDVLEPGGRINLITRIVYREILLAEAENSNIEGIDDWLDISEDLWLSRQWLEMELESIYEAGLDSSWIDSMISIDVSLNAVLLDDSASAAVILEGWINEGPSEPAIEMAIAPWSTGGSSYLDFQGDYLLLLSGNPSFAEHLIEYAGEGSVILPFFGAWAVVQIDTVHIDPGEYSIPIASRSYISTLLSHITDITVISSGIDELSMFVESDGSEYTFNLSEGFDPDLKVAEYPGGVLTAGEVVRIANLVVQDNFFRDIPESFVPFQMREPILDPEVDLWIYVEGIAEIKRQADLAVEAGIAWPQEERELTVTEHVLRKNVLEVSTEVDSLDAVEFYRDNQSMYNIPELRSIIVAYVPAEWMPNGEVKSLEDLDKYYMHADSSGVPVPTKLCPVELFESYGAEVFEADSGVFTGPVGYGDDDVFVFFEVVDIVPEGGDDPTVILPLLIEDCRAAMVTRQLESYLLELWEGYSIEIDSVAARNLDPWDTSY